MGFSSMEGTGVTCLGQPGGGHREGSSWWSSEVRVIFKVCDVASDPHAFLLGEDLPGFRVE